MSWLEKLYQTYDRCAGQLQFEQSPLHPVSHVEQQAHVEIVLDESGHFLRASIVSKEPTLIPATEKSAGRASGPVAHPLCDKVRYLARDYDPPSGKKSVHHLYLDQLRAWVASEPHPKLQAILAYVERGEVVSDLISHGILWKDAEGRLITSWQGEIAPPIARLLTPDPKTRERDQGDALVRWRVELSGDKESAVWLDSELRNAWIRFDSAQSAATDLCLVTGSVGPVAVNHPKRLRHGADAAKLISSNDGNGFTFRGRFDAPSEAYAVGSVVTQKAHNALRWLIARQGLKHGDQVIVSWAVGGQPTPSTAVSTFDLFFESGRDSDPSTASIGPSPGYEGDAGQAFAARLNKLIRGYASRLGDRDDIVVMALDSATPGRMAILYYRELQGSEFLARIQHWHESFAWPQNFGKERQFIGAPAPRDIAEAAYGRRVDDKLRKATVERLLPCIIDARPIPHDLVTATVQRACNRAGMKLWEWEQILGIACSLVRGSNSEEHDTMSLDEARTTRDYLYGRLLAIAENIESLALFVAKENRDTSAAKLMQRFADHPYTTWRTLELGLRPYMSRLRTARGGVLTVRERLIDEVMGLFRTSTTGDSEFLDNSRLSGEFLLGYHGQRSALKPKNSTATSGPETDDAVSEPLGENQ
jgi:CRISPR-associated protein Csd1